MAGFMIAIALGLSAGIFEELVRYLAMRFLMKQRDWQSGFLFGAGHGDIEAVLFVGINVMTMISSSTSIIYGEAFLLLERFSKRLAGNDTANLFLNKGLVRHAEDAAMKIFFITTICIQSSSSI